MGASRVAIRETLRHLHNGLRIVASVLSGLLFQWAWTLSDHGEYMFALIGTAVAVGLGFIAIYGWNGFPEQPSGLTKTLKVVVGLSAFVWAAVQAFVIYRNKGAKPWTNFRASDFVTIRSYLSLVMLLSWKWLVLFAVGALGYAVGRLNRPKTATDRESALETQPSDAPPSVQSLAEKDRTAIADRVKLIGISYNPNFAKGYIDLTLAVYNDSIFDVVLELSIKGDDLRFSPDWERFHYELKTLAKTPIACSSRDGCFFTLRQPLTDGECRQFQDDYDRVVGFSALNITIKGKDELDDVQSRPLKTDEYVHTKRGMWRIADEMQALFVLANKRTEAAEGTSLSTSVTEADISAFIFDVTVEVEPDGLAPRVYSGFAGTTGQSKPLKSFAMYMAEELSGLSLYYQGFFEDGSSSDFQDEAAVIQRLDESGKKLDIRGFSVKLAGEEARKYDVVYSAHVRGTGNLERNYKNGEFCGADDRAIEGMKVVVCRKGVNLPSLL